jgi:hypothetical protein
MKNKFGGYILLKIFFFKEEMFLLDNDGKKILKNKFFWGPYVAF